MGGHNGSRRAARTTYAFPPLRRLAPARKAYTRGKFKMLSRSERREALAFARREVLAESSRGPAKSKLKTILKFLSCFGLRLVPFTVRVVHALAAALKWRGYRSADLYLYHARATAERSGAHISLAARRALKDMVRSCRRGIGPSKRCEGLILERLPTLTSKWAPWAHGGPWRPRAALVIGSWWMLREVEFSGAELRAVYINTQNQAATLALPASKTDPAALGVEITHGCCCGVVHRTYGARDRGREAARARSLCPYHQLLDHMAAMYLQYPARFDKAGYPKAGFPLFPEASGKPCTKDGVTATGRHAAAKLGQAVRDASGLWLHSGHAMRVTGAQALARAGLSEHQISLLARWGSSAVLRYIRSAPLTSSHRLAAQALAGWIAARNFDHVPGSEAGPRCSVARLSQPKKQRTSGSQHSELKRVAGLETRLEKLESGLSLLSVWRSGVEEALAESRASPIQDPPVDIVIPTPAAHAEQRYVLSAYHKCHLIQVGWPHTPAYWSTACGWRFGLARNTELVDHLPAHYKELCEKCFPEERATAKKDAQAAVKRLG